MRLQDQEDILPTETVVKIMVLYGWNNVFNEVTENFKEKSDDIKVVVNTKIWFTGDRGKSMGEWGWEAKGSREKVKMGKGGNMQLCS